MAELKEIVLHEEITGLREGIVHWFRDNNIRLTDLILLYPSLDKEGNRITVKERFLDEEGRNTRIENIDSIRQYLEYCNENCINLIFDGNELYDILNGNFGEVGWDLEDSFNKMLESYGVYYELGHAWNAGLFVIDDKKTPWFIPGPNTEKEPVSLYCRRLDEIQLPALRSVAQTWKDLELLPINDGKDIGSCIIGAHFKFTYQDEKYNLYPFGRYQSDFSYSQYEKVITELLKSFGATNIYYDCGCMD